MIMFFSCLLANFINSPQQEQINFVWVFPCIGSKSRDPHFLQLKFKIFIKLPPEINRNFLIRFYKDPMLLCCHPLGDRSVIVMMDNAKKLSFDVYTDDTTFRVPVSQFFTAACDIVIVDKLINDVCT